MIKKILSFLALAIVLVTCLAACDGPFNHVHQFCDWAVVKEATETEEGLKERTCACGEKEIDSIPMKCLKFTSNGDGTCYVSGIGGCTDTNIAIPSTSPDGDRVTSIGYMAFCNCTGLASIEIPGSVTSIGYAAFRGCTGFTSIVIPDSVTSIGNEAFRDCTGLTSIVIPDSVTSIGTP
ncbi:MAG: leucine-rich repeat domain-containing protein, partial [Clostridia bacterium]|nr:leucine-rich repeat domain-containing protein [Clostridia bacterium]